MKLNLENLRKAIESDTENVRGNNTENSQYKLVYPFNEGKYKVRILYNPKGQIVQRKVLRHATSDKKVKVPCLSVFGEDCPVCNAIKEAEFVRGKDCGAFKKYGYNVRGICYAQLIDAPDETFKDGNVSRGDIVMLMYPKTVFNAINNIMIESGEELESIISDNLGHPIIIENSRNSNPTYSVQISLKKEQMCDTDEQFEEILNNLPNINEQFVPLHPDDDIRKSAKALADVVRSEYLDKTIIDPGTVPNVVYGEEVKYTQANTVPTTEVKTVPEITEDDDLPFVVNDTVAETVSTPTPADVPECYGCYKNGEKKCMLCVKEIDCMKATK